MHIDSPATFSKANLQVLCDTLGKSDADLSHIVETYGYPPFWDRPNSFETLTHIILEQQVSLASARAALEKLRARVDTITPEYILGIKDHEFTGLYISRQKKAYIQNLAQEVIDGSLDLESLATQSDDAVRARLIRLKGIGSWTADIYLIMVLHRPDHFPFGDIAAVTALKQLKNLPKETSREELEQVVNTWEPYRSIAAILLWHHYLSVRGRKY